MRMFLLLEPILTDKILIALVIVFAGLAALGGLQVKHLKGEIKTVQADLRTAELDLINTRADAEACSKSVIELQDKAEQQKEQAQAEIKQAEQGMQAAIKSARQRQAAPPAVPDDDAASAHYRIDTWLESR